MINSIFLFILITVITIAHLLWLSKQLLFETRASNVRKQFYLFFFLLRFEMLWRTKFACPVCSVFDFTGVTSSCEVRTCKSLNSLKRNRIIAGLVSIPMLHPLYFEPHNALVCKSGWSLVQVSNCQITVQLLGPQRYNTVAKIDMGLCPTSKTVSFLWKKKGTWTVYMWSSSRMIELSANGI